MDEDLETYFEGLSELCSLAKECSMQNKLPDAYCTKHRALSENMIREAHAGLENLPLSDAETCRRRIDEIYNQMQLKIQLQREVALKELETMTPTQQEKAVSFWEITEGFFTKMFSWLRNAFRRIVELIKKGVKIVAKIARVLTPLGSLIAVIFGLVSVAVIL